MMMSPLVGLLIHILGIIAFIWFVHYWASLFSKRIEPALRHRVSQNLGIEIRRWERGSRYHWITPDKRSQSQRLVFFWCALLFLIIGGGPMVVALVVVGLILNVINP